MEVCRLCLDLIAAQGEAKLLDGEARDMVQVVAPELNLDVSDDPLACGECTESLAALFEFKSRCFEHEAEVREKVGERRGELTLRDALAGEAGGGGDRLEEPGGSRPKAKDRLCRTCLAPIECESFTVLQPSEPDAYLSSMLDMCLVEVDLELTKDPVMCENCLENLQKLHHFKSSCQDVEDKIVEYCETHKVKEGDTIELHKVLESEMAMPDVEMALVKKEPDEAGTSGAKVKTEKESDGGDASQGDEDMSDADDELKQEEIDIKSEAGTSDSDKPSLQYKCGTCNIVTLSREALLTHRRDHHLKFVVTCSICGKKCNHRGHLVLHYKAHHKDAGALKTCQYCPYKTLWKSNVKRHELECHPGLLKCTQCPYTTRFEQNLLRHQTDRHSAESMCNMCDFQTFAPDQLLKHVEKLHPIQHGWLRCSYCEFKTFRRFVMNDHVITKHEKYEDSLNRCPHCEYRAYNPGSIYRHVHLEHGNKEDDELKNCDRQKRECTTCYFQTYSKAELASHELGMHNMGPTMDCIMCDKIFSTRRQLSRHMSLTHTTNDSLLKCPFCPFASLFKWSVTMHIDKSHVETVQCSLCTFKTSSKSYIKVHLKKVHNQGDQAEELGDSSQSVDEVTCSFCKYVAKSKRGLARHKHVHYKKMNTNKKQPFSSANVKKVPTDTIFNCDFCEFSTDSQISFYMHHKTKHTEIS